jgi:hypothetical protein
MSRMISVVRTHVRSAMPADAAVVGDTEQESA